MNLTLAHIGARASSKDGFDPLCQAYLDRCAPFAHCLSEAFKAEETMFEWLDRQQRRLERVATNLESALRDPQKEKSGKPEGSPLLVER
jgi:hypothetical protein